MPVTGPIHVNPFIGGADLHTPSPAPSPTPEGPAVTSSRPSGSTGPLQRLGALRVRTNPLDTPRASTNPFDTPRASTNPFDSASFDSHSSGEVGAEHGPGETPSSPRPMSGLAPRADTAAAFARLRNRHAPSSTPGLHTPRFGATLQPREAQPDAAFAEAAPESPHSPNRPSAEGAPPREETSPHAAFAEAAHGEPAAPTGPAARPQGPHTSAAEFAEETMEQTGEFMSPMIQAQMFAAESQMFISMVQAQVDVAKAAASAVSDAARKS